MEDNAAWEHDVEMLRTEGEGGGQWGDGGGGLGLGALLAMS